MAGHIRVESVQYPTQFHSSFSLDSKLLCCSFCSQQIERQVFLARCVHGLHFTLLFSPSLIEYNPYMENIKQHEENIKETLPWTLAGIMESFIWHHKGIYECFCFDVAPVAIIHKNI